MNVSLYIVINVLDCTIFIFWKIIISLYGGFNKVHGSNTQPNAKQMNVDAFLLQSKVISLMREGPFMYVETNGCQTIFQRPTKFNKALNLTLS